MELGNRLGLTFGNQIKYNENIWKYCNNDNLRYYMAEDIIKIIENNNLTKNEIIRLLGRPNLGNSSYFLKSENLFWGIDIYVLTIDFVDDIAIGAKIIR